MFLKFYFLVFELFIIFKCTHSFDEEKESNLRRKHFKNTKPIENYKQNPQKTDLLIKNWNNSSFDVKNLTFQFLDTSDQIMFCLIDPINNFTIFKNSQKLFGYWKLTINSKDYTKNKQMLKYTKRTNIHLLLSNESLIELIKLSANNFNFQLFEFLYFTIRADLELSINLITDTIGIRGKNIPVNDHEITAQFNTVRFLIKNNINVIPGFIKSIFGYFIFTLNIKLVKYIIDEFEIDVNEQSYGIPHWFRIIFYLTYPDTPNIERAIHMFEFLLNNGADLNIKSHYGNSITFEIIKYIPDIQIRNRLFKIIHLKHCERNQISFKKNSICRIQ